ncbi:hypothetical protein C4D60_Mb02t09620 [Musa balbisiana]|uniref:HMA domain-containing protein n=1 Tax=Musa balbisiana TaxID=52838 RepID=A0A4S8I9P2_MUSBA|nr:hypothetical protein C4D60_Mb02t09620 [Musa balbisiana]
MCNKCKICIMTIIAHFEGVVSIALDAERNTVTIVGNVDATLIVKALRKAKKTVDIVSVGEARKDMEEKMKKKMELCTPSQSHCSSCRPKIVLKVCIMCNKCKICIMTTIARFEGVVSIALDAERNTVTIVGNVDATLIVKALRKARKTVDIVSVGETSKYMDEKTKKVELCTTSQSHCSSCRPVMVVCGETKGCSIL